MLDTEDAENIADRLPQRSHRYNPAIALAVDDGLSNVRDQGKGEENGEEVRGSGIGAEVGPFTVWVILSWAASHCEYGVQMRGRGAGLISAVE